MLEGGLKDLSIEDLLQMVSLGEKTGELILSGETPLGKTSGKIYFEKGQVKNAETEDLKGEPAVIELLILKDGNFKFIPKDISQIEKSIYKSVQDLLILSTSKLDEWNKIKDKISSVDSSFELSLEDIPDEISLNRTHWEVLNILRTGNTIRQTALKLNMNIFDVAGIAYGLVVLGIIKRIEEKLPEREEFEQNKTEPKGLIRRFFGRNKPDA
ncbi:MAG: hypothetical protein COS15_04275 [Caldiserica bacterium CG02_land_8_20_14_3_00_36_38]|nr:MAG: hypothetical protein AUJ99_01240 [Caldisericum sp. CG2_30_36_11]PIP49534.1 MAG: hypothetical protein COX13_03515 [Caldiserica bacterium CG23_combo_of_CG06-09_8_20_14_all_35_60]PIV55065.1 MAG: hypothetical protein COS15_04275 [Caldiserica bacterium CG02_land_8_20_14_3_00_36_38]